MPPGSMLIHRNDADNTGYDVTSWTVLEFNTTVFMDSHVFSVTSEGFSVLEDGHYLIMHNDGFEIDTTLDRCTFQTRITVNGSEEGGTKGHGYIRGQEGCDECFPYNAQIISLSAYDVIEVECKQEASTTPSPTRMTDIGSIQALKLDDDWDYCRRNAYRVSVQQDLGVSVIWYTDIETDSGTFSVSGSDITLGTAGWYLCTYSVGWRNASTPPARMSCSAWVEIDGTPVIQSYSSSYVRVTSGSLGTTNAIFFVKTTSDDQVLTLETSGNGLGGGTLEFGAETYISIAKLPDDLIIPLDIYDSTGGQSFDVSETPFDWDAENEVGSAYEHDTGTGPDNVDIARPGAFLFTGNFSGNRASGTNRYNTLSSWRLNGTALNYGKFGDYNRGDPTRTPKHGACHGILFPYLSVGDVIELAREDTSTSSGTAPVTVADNMGVQAVYLPSIFPGYWQPGGFFLQGGY